MYSNLVHVTPTLWEAFSRPGVRLATSFYSDDPVKHMRITGRNTLLRTQGNIEEAVARAIPVGSAWSTSATTSGSPTPGTCSSASG